MLSKLQNLVTEFMTEHRGIFVTVFVLPISLVFDLYFAARAWVVFKMYSAPKLHNERVKKIQSEIRDWHKNGGQGKLCTARGGWQSISLQFRPYKNKMRGINVNLYDILELNKEEQWVRVEPLVNMGMLSHFLVKHNLTIPVLPEMDDLTVGGLFMGVGIETSSHKYGLFNDSIIEAEVVLSSGEVVTCSKTENRELFDALPWSYGTLGFLVSCKIKVIPSKPFVRIEYIPCTTQAEGIETFKKYVMAEKPVDFVEALAYSRETMVVMPASFVDANEVEAGKLNQLGRWYKPWFFKYVESFFTKGRTVEYLPLRDYYHRHTRSIFWYMQDIIPWGNNPVFRFLLGWAVPPKVSFLKLTQTEAIAQKMEKENVVQDMLVPLSVMGQSLDKFEEQYRVYPLWICPYRAYDYSDNNVPHRCFLRRPLNLEKGKDYEMYVDLGAYGVPQDVRDKKPFDHVTVAREVEKYVASVHGFQMLYADSYLTYEEFRHMFDHSHYDSMKSKYDAAGAFPQVFDKVCMKGLKKYKDNNNEDAKTK